MKSNLLIILSFLFMCSCSTYKSFVPVKAKADIPDGVQYIVLNETLDSVKNAFKNKGILIKSMEGGFETEEILLDEGTRAKYKAHAFDNQVRISAFWGITQKVKSQITVWAGADAASAYDVNAWDKVLYDNKSARPKLVFDYAVEIIESNGFEYNLK